MSDGTPPSTEPSDQALEQLWPGLRLVRTSIGSAAGYIALPSASRPTLLVPAAPRAAAVTVASGYASAVTATARARRLLLRTGFGVGGAALFRRRLVATAPGIDAELGRVLGRDVAVGVYLGRPRANRKPVIQVLSPDGQPLAFAKVGINELTDRLVSAEADALERLAGQSLGLVVVPSVLHRGTWQGHPLVVQSALTIDPATVSDDALFAASLQICSIGADVRPLRACTPWSVLVNDLERAPAHELTDALRVGFRRLEPHADRPVPAGVGHGDWTPGNIAMHGTNVAVWDWERYAEHQPVGFDLLHHDLQSRLFWTKETNAPQHWRAAAADRLNALGVDRTLAPLLTAAYLLCLLARWVADVQPVLPDARSGMVQTLTTALDDMDAAR